MKKLITFLICCSLALTFCFPGAAYAQGEEELPDHGITPDSPFYFLDTLGKKLGLMFTFGDEAKAQKALEYAGERLAEANAMALKNKLKEMTQAAGEYDQFMATVNERLQAAVQQNASANISEKVALATAKHLAVLDRVRDRVPEEGKEALNRARERSLNEHQHALRALAEHQPERATEINLGSIQNRLYRALDKASENATDEVENALEDSEKLRRFGEEISEIARGLSDNTTTDELVAKATSVHLQVLAQIHGKVPEPAREAIENAMANALQNREQVIERLRSRAALGDIPEDVPALQQIQAEVMERIQNRIQERIQEGIQERLKEKLQEQEQTSKLQPEAPENMLEQLPEEAPIPEELPEDVNQKIAPGDSRRK